ncbi:MAG: hypothetical protein JJU11_08120 [Candidatus Sumerlaeia bacterium]|nr:hypothetical protein [Candidatus Sumerlaeia bacterium]
MLAEIKQLLQVQELDKEIIHIKETIARYPKVWEQVKDKLTKAREAQALTAAAEEKFEKDKRRMEQKLRLTSDEYRRAQTQQNAVKTAKEYEAASKQLEHVKRQMEDIQKRAELLLEKEDETKKAAADAQAELEKIEALYKSEKKRIREQFNEKKTHLEQLEARRLEEFSRVDAKSQLIYERALVRYPGNSVVPVVNEKPAGSDRGTNGCAGCYFEVLPEELVRIRQENDIITCTNCGRLLYEEVEYSSEHSEVG